MTCRQLQSDLSQMLDSVEITWWAPEDLWDEARLKAGQIHLLDGRKDAARFVEHSTAYQIVVDVTPWLSHPLAKQLATWINPDLDPQLSEEQSSPLGLLRRMSIALSGPSAIPGHLDRLKWQGAATLAHVLGAIGESRCRQHSNCYDARGPCIEPTPDCVDDLNASTNYHAGSGHRLAAACLV